MLPSASVPTRAGLATVGAAVAGLAYAAAEAQAYTLRRFTLPVLPAEHAPLRVLHLSDLHMLPRQRRKQTWVRSLAALEPDLVVSTGDNLASLDAVPAVLAAHGELLDRPGVFVLGSNDYWAPRPKNPARYFLRSGGRRRIHGVRLPTRTLVAGFRAAGWLDLTNRRDALTVGGTRLEFAGVDDPHLNLDRYDLAARPPLARPGGPAPDVTVGVAHAPYRRVLDAMVADGADLLLAGHTHGGQLCVPGLGALVTNCDLPRRQARGVSTWPPQHEDPARGPGPGAAAASSSAVLHVCAGLGTSPYTPVRFACRPEAALLTLTPASGRS